MIGRFKNALFTAIGVDDPPPLSDDDEVSNARSHHNSSHSRYKYPYQRPLFLQLFSEDEIEATADHLIRPIILPRDVNVLPWHSGYAECINAGKSLRNEDQATCHSGVLRSSDIPNVESNTNENGCSTNMLEGEIPYTMFGVFDGHAGASCAISVANEFYLCLHKSLMKIINHLLRHVKSIVALEACHRLETFEKREDVKVRHNKSSVAYTIPTLSPSSNSSTPELTIDSLIRGALECAFHDMDQQLATDKRKFRILGGCTAVVSLFILGKVFVANAGDSRSVLVKTEPKFIEDKLKKNCDVEQGDITLNESNAEELLRLGVKEMSYDFTPVSERQRLQEIAHRNPSLLGSEYYNIQYYGLRRPLKTDLGCEMLVRYHYMSSDSWTPKIIENSDFNKFPIVFGRGKRSRLLATIGVTRGFGDHELKAQTSTSFGTNQGGLPIKPFLSSKPQIIVHDCHSQSFSKHEKDSFSNSNNVETDIPSHPGSLGPTRVDVEDVSEEILIIASDGLWDVVPYEDLSYIVNVGVSSFDKLKHSYNNNIEDSDEKKSQECARKYRYISIAQNLVSSARGKQYFNVNGVSLQSLPTSARSLTSGNIQSSSQPTISRNANRVWRRTSPINNEVSHTTVSCDSPLQNATIDDISTFVIPLNAYLSEYKSWLENRIEKRISDLHISFSEKDNISNAVVDCIENNTAPETDDQQTTDAVKAP